MSKEMRSLLNNKFQCSGSKAACYYEMKCHFKACASEHK